MSNIKELAVSCAFLEGIGAQAIIGDRFSENECDLFYKWFDENWDDSWDKEMIDYHLETIAKKINELKGIKK